MSKSNKEYLKFLESKKKTFIDSGFDIEETQLNKNLFDFQKFAVKTALKKGKFALFFDCGLGKTLMQLSWAEAVFNQTNKKVLILAPLAVVEQTKEEAIKTVEENNQGYFDLAYNYACKWVSEQMRPFTSEDLSKDMYLVLGTPREPRVLGAVFNRLSKEQRIKFVQYVKYRSLQGHGKPSAQWISREYSQKQSKNATKDRTLDLFESDSE